MRPTNTYMVTLSLRVTWEVPVTLMKPFIQCAVVPPPWVTTCDTVLRLTETTVDS